MNAVRRSWCRLWAGAVLLLLTPVLATATLILPQELGEKARESTVIVRGKVTSIQSHWNEDRTLILTEVQLKVDETLKGAPRSLVILELLGGQVEDVALDVVGSPTFAVGEEVVVFTAPNKSGRLHLPNLAQDKFSVERSADGRAWVRNEVQPFNRLLPEKSLTLDKIDKQGRLPLQDFLLELRKSLRGGAR